MKTTAPIILFVYNRPDHARQCLDALAGNIWAQESRLIIFADGPKAGASPAEQERIRAVREIINQEHRFGAVEVHASDTNKGLSASIIAGVTSVLHQYGRAIIMEDDLIADQYFLSFMNDALEYYQHNEKVACISGYIYPVEEPLPEQFFLKGADCWGWATWQHQWQLFEQDGSRLLQELHQRDLAYDFNFYDTYPYMEMLEDQIRGKNNSWAIRWYAAAFLKNKLTLYPGRSLIKNIGFDGTGTHSGYKGVRSTELANRPRILQAIPVEENTAAKEIIARYFRKKNTRTIFARFKATIRRLLKK